LTRLVDKRKVRRDRADVFCTKAEGVRGQQAVEWGLVDAVVPRSRFDDHVRERALARAAASDRPDDEPGVALTPLGLVLDGDQVTGSLVTAELDRGLRAATITVRGPSGDQPADLAAARAAGAAWWPLAACRELDAVALHLRFNEPTIGTWVLRTVGDAHAVLAADSLLAPGTADWFAREVRLYWARTLKRLDLSARTLVALVEPGSCFAGTLAELAFAADRTLMLDGTVEGVDEPPATMVLGPANDGWYPMANGLSRLGSRFWGHDDLLVAARAAYGKDLLAADAATLGLVTDTPDDLDWDDEVRLLVEERASFSPDALTAMEANLRFVGPETVETKIFGRLTAWQNWVFQRPNAAGPEGALRRYGTGSRPAYDPDRI
jgi:benzoyl-CoA-dihydrodiol lyase